MRWPGSRPSRRNTGASCQAPPVKSRVVVCGSGISPIDSGTSGSCGWLAAAKRLDLDRLDLDRLVGTAKPKRCRCIASNAVLSSASVPKRHGQGAVGAEIAEMQLHAARGCRSRATPWPTSSVDGLLRERRGRRFRGSQALRIEQREHGLGPRGLQLGKPHAVGRQHAGQRMDQHAADAERIGDEAGMLPARAAEGVEHIVGDVVAALHRDGLDRVRHVLDRDADEAVGDLCGLARRRRSPRQARRSAPARPPRRAAGPASAPKIFGKNSGSSLPTMTLASVTVSGPPRR